MRGCRRTAGSAALLAVVFAAFAATPAAGQVQNLRAGSGPTAYADRPECLALLDLDFVSLEEKQANLLIEDEFYFCAEDAPRQFACKCPSSTVCVERLSARGRDLGLCGCCAIWVYAILGALGAMGLAAVLFCLYLCFCRGEWWCDGYHPPINPFLPKRGAPVVIPGSIPLPNGVFRGYRPAEFDSGLSPEDLARAREAQQRQRAAAQAAAQQQQQMREEQREARRRREAGGAADAPPAAAAAEEASDAPGAV